MWILAYQLLMDVFICTGERRPAGTVMLVPDPHYLQRRLIHLTDYPAYVLFVFLIIPEKTDHGSYSSKKATRSL